LLKPDDGWQAYLEKTNTTLRAAAEEMQDLRKAESAESRPASDRERNGSQSWPSGSESNAAGSGPASDSLHALHQQNEDAGSSAAVTDAQHQGKTVSSESEQGTAHPREEGGDQSLTRSKASEGCPYIGFTASANFMDAQTLWDASMAYSIAQHLLRAHDVKSVERVASIELNINASSSASDNEGPQEAASCSESISDVVTTSISSAGRPLVLHMCGKFHSEGWMGIPEHLQAYKQGLNVLVVTFLPTSKSMEITRADFVREKLDQYGDFVILTDIHSPRSFAIEHPV